MLVDDEQLVLILYHPVSIEQLSDDLVFLLGIFCQFNVQIPICQTFIDIFDKQINNSGNVSFVSGRNMMISSRRFRIPDGMRFQFVHNKLFIFRADVSVLIDSFQQVGRTDIGCHDQDGILKSTVRP